MRRIEFDLPLPPPEVSPNKCKGNWRAKGAAVQAYRTLCMLQAKEALRKADPASIPQAPVTIHLHFYLKRPKKGEWLRKWGGIYHAGNFYYPRDEDNARASAKAMQDALADAGLFPSDGKRYVRAGETRIYSSAKEHKGRTGLIVIVEEQEG